MIRTALFGLLMLAPRYHEQDPTVDTLLRQLDHQDWLEQAKAAKALLAMGDRVLGKLGAERLSPSPSKSYWANTIYKAIKSGGVAPAPTPAPTPVAVTPAPAARSARRDINPRFNPERENQGVVVFICNTVSHGDYEVVIKTCPTCAKQKKFSWDYVKRPLVVRCATCKVKFTGLKCDRCSRPPHPRRPIQIRPR